MVFFKKEKAVDKIARLRKELQVRRAESVQRQRQQDKIDKQNGFGCQNYPCWT